MPFKKGSENFQFKHGLALKGNAHPDYNIWAGMRHRCNNSNYHAYPDYGGRGITVCPQWDSFEQFVADMGPRPPGHEIERKNNDGNYEPSNCRWATRKEQCRNTRLSHTLTVNGVTCTIAEWAEKSGIWHQTIRTRIKRGWNPERAVTKPTEIHHVRIH